MGACHTAPVINAELNSNCHPSIRHIYIRSPRRPCSRMDTPPLVATHPVPRIASSSSLASSASSPALRQPSPRRPPPPLTTTTATPPPAAPLPTTPKKGKPRYPWRPGTPLLGPPCPLETRPWAARPNRCWRIRASSGAVAAPTMKAHMRSRPAPAGDTNSVAAVPRPPPPSRCPLVARFLIFFFYSFGSYI